MAYFPIVQNIAPNSVTTAQVVNGTLLPEDLSEELRANATGNIITVNPALSQDYAGVSYQNLQNAMAYANANATASIPIIIQLNTNIDLTVPVTITNPNVTLRGGALFEIQINVDNALAGQTAITVDLGAGAGVPTFYPIQNLTIQGTNTLETTANTVGLDIRCAGVMYMQNLRITNFNECLILDNDRTGPQFIIFQGLLSVVDAGLYGIYANSTNGQVQNILAAECNIGLFFDTLCEFTVAGGTVTGAPAEIGQNIGAIVNTDDQANLINIEFLRIDKGVEVNGDGQVKFIGCLFDESIVNNHAEVNGAADIITSNTFINLSKVIFNNTSSTITGTFTNNQVGDVAYAIFEELNVGSPLNGRETTLGEGDSYTIGALYSSFDGVGYTDVKDQLIRLDGTGYSFPNLNTNTALYLSNIYGKRFMGIKLDTLISANLGGGDIVLEYWDGTTWSEFNHMLAGANPAYIPYANDKFTQPAGAYQARYDERIQNDWALNDPPGLGVPGYWMRLRISSPITTSPEFDKIKIHSSRMEFNSDGTQEAFSNARPIKKLPVNYGSFQAAATSPGNQDIYLSDTLFAGRAENNFADNTTDATGLAIIVPYDLDTSCPIKVRINYHGESATQSGNVRWEVRWGHVSEGGDIFRSTAQAPALAPTQQNIVVLDAVTVADFFNRTKTFVAELEVPEIIPQVVGGAGGDLLFITIARNANIGTDTYEADITINDISFEYTSWRIGGHVLAQ